MPGHVPLVNGGDSGLDSGCVGSNLQVVHNCLGNDSTAMEESVVEVDGWSESYIGVYAIKVIHHGYV